MTKNQNQVFIKTTYQIPQEKILPDSELTYAATFLQYYETVISDTKMSYGPLFRHFFKKSGMYTKTPFGINAMTLVRKEINQILKK